jgi:hypothetical protein
MAEVVVELKIVKKIRPRGTESGEIVRGLREKVVSPEEVATQQCRLALHNGAAIRQCRLPLNIAPFRTWPVLVALLYIESVRGVSEKCLGIPRKHQEFLGNIR